jgi:phenylacetate-CoA ligase
LLVKAVARAKTEGVIDAAIRNQPGLRRRVLDTLRRHAEQAERVEEELTARIVHAARRTPYGARRPERIADWPVLEKEALRARPEDFVNPRALIRVPAATGGTSGIPLKLWRSLECVVAEQVFLDGLLAPHGFSMRSKMAVLRGDNIKAPGDTDPPYGRIGHGGKRLTLSSPHLNADTLPWYQDALDRFAPEVFWVYPNAAAKLLALCERAGRRFELPVMFASSETLSAPVHRALEEYFGCPVINYYGQAERVCLAWSTRPDEWYFDPRYGRVELGEPEPCDASVSVARIIGTSYWNTTMPLIRYDTGDSVYVPRHYGAKELAEIAAGKRPFPGIAGRDNEYLLDRDGMRILGLNQIPREIDHVFQLQLIQPDFDTLWIDVLAMPGFGEKDVQAIEERAQAKVPASMRITVRVVERLYKTPRGKIPLVVRQVAESGEEIKVS